MKHVSGSAVIHSSWKKKKYQRRLDSLQFVLFYSNYIRFLTQKNINRVKNSSSWMKNICGSSRVFPFRSMMARVQSQSKQAKGGSCLPLVEKLSEELEFEPWCEAKRVSSAVMHLSCKKKNQRKEIKVDLTVALFYSISDPRHPFYKIFCSSSYVIFPTKENQLTECRTKNVSWNFFDNQSWTG